MREAPYASSHCRWWGMILNAVPNLTVMMLGERVADWLKARI
jgi:hypothetical protein